MLGFIKKLLGYPTEAEKAAAKAAAEAPYKVEVEPAPVVVQKEAIVTAEAAQPKIEEVKKPKTAGRKPKKQVEEKKPRKPRTSKK